LGKQAKGSEGKRRNRSSTLGSDMLLPLLKIRGRWFGSVEKKTQEEKSGKNTVKKRRMEKTDGRAKA